MFDNDLEDEDKDVDESDDGESEEKDDQEKMNKQLNQILDNSFQFKLCKFGDKATLSDFQSM